MNDAQPSTPGRRYPLPKNQRLDTEIYAEPGTLTHITIRAYQHQTPFRNPLVDATVVKTLTEDRLRLGVLVLVYCLMPDHLHLLLTPRKKGCSVLTFVDQFKGKSTNVSWKVGWQGKLWQPRNYDHVLRIEEEFAATAIYILENPLREGMVQRPRDYLWQGGMDVWGGWHVGLAYAEWEERNRATTTGAGGAL